MNLLDLLYDYLNVTGDEIISVNGKSMEGFKHSQAIALFKEVKCGQIVIQVGRRDLIKR